MADRTLGLLGYNSNPSKLQRTIDMIYKHAIRQIKIKDCEVVGFEMSKSLNSKDSKDYCQRVEPSSIGGRKIAENLVKILDSNSNDNKDNRNSNRIVEETIATGKSVVDKIYKLF